MALEAFDEDSAVSKSTKNDEQYARDIQLAMELQDKEERRNQPQRQQRRKNRHSDRANQHSFCTPAQMKRTADHMLYVLCEVDERAVEMLVDSGASSSAISSVMVDRLGLRHKLSPHIAGRASGVGSAQILGALENIGCSIGHVEFRLFFVVIESAVPFLILGLDQMRRFKCVIDLDKSALCFGGNDGVSVPFLTKELASQAATTTYMTNQEAPPPQPQQHTSNQQQQQRQQQQQPQRRPGNVVRGTAVPLAARRQPPPQSAYSAISSLFGKKKSSKR